MSQPTSSILRHRFEPSAFDSPQAIAPWMDREWLLTNGSGAYAMGSVCGVNTRRYHGLLVACNQPPVGRVMVLNQMLERLAFPSSADGDVETTSCAFLDEEGRLLFAPAGHQWLRSFEKGVHAQWVYEHPRVTLRRELRLHWKAQAATLTYTIEPREDVTFTLQPMVTLRDFHAMRHAGQDHRLFAQAVQGDTLRLASADAACAMQSPGSVILLNDGPGRWWHSIYYTQDNDRGQEDREDHFLPAQFTHTLQGGESHTLTFTVTLGDTPASPVTDDATRAQHLKPIAQSLASLEQVRPGLPGLLAQAADDFVVDRVIQGRKLSTILAGYPWFADWGRDTFIALPGLLLNTSRYDEARDVLQAFARHIRDGLVPNRFDDYHAHDAHYNTVDASLWFIDAAMNYLAATDDRASWDDWLAPACMSIIDAYLKGTRYDIRMAGDGLITAGSGQTQLTWMDAACGDVVFTPRQGKAVEINALWHHALMGMSQLLAVSHRPVSEHYAKLASRTSRSFMKVFWDDRRKHLRDHVWVDDQGNEHVDASIRPNQVLAASLPHSPMPKTKRKVMLATVRGKLLTPYGLRTLPEGDPHYHARYHGPAFNRDEAYHQGTIWPWLIGPYVEATLRVDEFSAKAKAEARQTLRSLVDFLFDQGVGQLYEIHEAQPPHRQAGCPAQAWSVAQLIRVLSML